MLFGSDRNNDRSCIKFKYGTKTPDLEKHPDYILGKGFPGEGNKKEKEKK